MANRYWVGGTGTWDASNTANWSATSGGASGASVPGSADAVLIDANSGTGTITLGYSPAVQSVIMTGYTGTFDGVGSSYTITLSAPSTTFWSVPTGATLAGSPNITVNYTGSSARTFAGGNKTYGKLTIGGGTSTSQFNITGGNTFDELASTRTVGFTLTFNSSTTVNTWSVSGSSGNVIVVVSSSIATSRNLTITNRTSGIDYLDIQSITSPAQPVTFYVGANSKLRDKVVGIAAKAPVADEFIYVLSSGTSWTVPANWNNSSNEIHLFGGGGGGGGGVYSGGVTSGAGGGGGGGGGYTKLTNQTLSGVISYAIGAEGSGGSGSDGVAGGTTTWNSGASSANGGSGGIRSLSGPGGAGGVGSTYNGGTGGSGASGTTANTGYGAGGGGGAGGPLGNGGNGGNGFGSTTAANVAGGGGGGNGGGSNGGNASSATGGTGGNNADGVGGGASRATGFNGGGGGGTTGTTGRFGGGSGTDIANAGMGSGGGMGGGAGANESSGTIPAGLFGSGGGGGGVTIGNVENRGGTGGQGGIIIVYNAGSAPVAVNSGFFFLFG